MDVIKRPAIVIALLVQALLLFPRLNLLPLWDDERYTLQTASQSTAEIIEALRVDVHPPLYYFLVHGWLKLPLPGAELLRVRALSVLLALTATLLLHFLWLRGLQWERQTLFLALWVLSPFVVLYARMARSYMLQVALAIVAIRMAHDWLNSSGRVRATAGYAATAALLLYTHYLPGLAVVAGTAALGMWRRRWRDLAAVGLIALAYLPWLGVLFRTAALVGHTHPYWAGANWAVESFLKLTYIFVSFHFGETVPIWALALGAVLTPPIVYSWWTAWQSSKGPPTLFLLLAAIGYFVAASWVSFPFVGARLLFLLPFYYLFLLRGLDAHRVLGAVTYAGLILIAGSALASYYRKQDFLNKGYLVDFEEIARLVRDESQGKQAVVFLDRFMTSAGFYLHGSNFVDLEILVDDSARERALDRLRADPPRLAWYLHYTRDTAHWRLEGGFPSDYRVERYGFVPYSPLDRTAMRMLGFQERPTHLVEVLKLLHDPADEHSRHDRDRAAASRHSSLSRRPAGLRAPHSIRPAPG